MPSTITASNGQAFHLFQLPCSTTGSQESIRFVRLVNDLSDGYKSKRLFGSNTGLRRWVMEFPTLPSSLLSNQTVTGIDGAQVSKEEYLWSLYSENQVSGTPFVIQSDRNSQYYLVDCVTPELSYKRFLTKLYSSQLEVSQTRIQGVTVFDPSLMDNTSSAHWYNETSHGGSTTWNDKKLSSPINFTKTGDVVFNANPVNGHNTVRLSGTTFNGGLQSASAFDVCDAVIVFKVREATFGTVESIL